MIIKQNFHGIFRNKRIARSAGYLAIKILLHVKFKNVGLFSFYTGDSEMRNLLLAIKIFWHWRFKND